MKKNHFQQEITGSLIINFLQTIIRGKKKEADWVMLSILTRKNIKCNAEYLLPILLKAKDSVILK